MATIYDIAEKTGFSASTVARALNGKGYCSPSAKEKILRAAQEIGYVPHQAAKTLKNNITKKVSPERKGGCRYRYRRRVLHGYR